MDRDDATKRGQRWFHNTRIASGIFRLLGEALRRTLLPLFICALCLAASSASAASLLATQDKPEKNAAALERILDDLGKQRAEVIAIQRELVARPSMGPEAGGAGEEAKAAWLLAWLREKGISGVERLDSMDRIKNLDPAAKYRETRPNIIIRYPGAGGLDAGRTVWIICHLHVAAPGPLDKWNGSPWTLREEGDTLYGRGVVDNYQSITAALLLLESLTRNNARPPMNLGLILHWQNSGFRHILASRPELFKPDDLYLVPDHGNPQGSVFSTAEKGLLWLKLTVTGAQTHAAAGSSAISALGVGSRLITALPDLAEQFAVTNALFPAPTTTFMPTKAATSEEGINAVATAFTVYLDCRFTLPHTPETVERGLRSLADTLERESGTSISIEWLLAYPALPPTSAQSPVAEALKRAVKAQMPQLGELRAEGIGTTTAAAFLRARHLPVVSWAKMNPAARHSANEHAHINDHLDEARVFARILFDPKAAKRPAANSKK